MEIKYNLPDMIDKAEKLHKNYYNGGTIMRVISRFESYGKKMVTVMVGVNVLVMTEKEYDWLERNKK